MTRFLVVLLASLIAVACASVRSDVIVAQAFPAGATGKTVAIVPYTDNLKTAPEYAGYAGKLAAHLEAKGYDVVDASAAGGAAYIALFSYGIDAGTPINIFASTPAPNTGSIITYGIRAPYNHATRRVYSRRVTLEILDRARFMPSQPATFVSARVYSAAVTSDGACASIGPVIDPMLAALFADFPGASGGPRRVDVPADTACGPNRYG